jgi:magnesium-transporting ATPase (P-type)
MTQQHEGTGSGLTSDEAAIRLAQDGPNRLPSPRRPSLARHLLEQLVHFFAVMLWVEGVLAFVAGSPELGVAIFVVIVVNATFAFVQENRADRAADRLHALRRCRRARREEASPFLPRDSGHHHRSESSTGCRHRGRADRPAGLRQHE